MEAAGKNAEQTEREREKELNGSPQSLENDTFLWHSWELNGTSTVWINIGTVQTE